MNKALQSALVSKPNVKGMLCADGNGLCIAAKGELDGSKSGWFTSVARRAKVLGNNVDNSGAIPTIVIETNNRNVLIKEYDSMTIVLKSLKSED